MAETSVSAERLLLSSATTSRPSAPSPSTETRSRAAPPAVGTPSNSKVTTLTAGPRMAGFDSTHSCRSARCSRPASSSEIICAGIATDPATVKSISSAISQDRLGQTVVFRQVPKVTRQHNGTTKLVARRRADDASADVGQPPCGVGCDAQTWSDHDATTRIATTSSERTGHCPESQRIVERVSFGSPTSLCSTGMTPRHRLARLRSAPPARRVATDARARRPGPGRAAVARRAAGR